MKKNQNKQEFERKKEIEELKTGLIKNAIKCYVVKGQIQDLAEAH